MEKIGRYQILGEIGRGAMGVVYRAQDPAIGRVIAIKTIRLSDLTDESERDRLRDRLFREAQSAGILSHTNIVTIYDIAEDAGMAFIFMELVNGPSLEHLLNESTPDQQAVINVLKQTAAALDYAHKKGIVHRDIKPANIMIHEDGQAKITDFGVAKIVSQQMTQTGAMMGTPNYMSPEQVQGHPVDGRADQFALAVIAYEILTGEKPFTGDYLPTLLYKIVREDPVAPQRLNPTLGAQVEAVLRKALAKNAEERYGSCTEFINALSFALGNSRGWQPFARGLSQSMPTVAGPIAPLPEEPKYKTNPTPVPPPVVAATRDAADSGGNPIMRKAIWLLVGLGLIGAAILGAKYALTSGEDHTQISQTNPASQPQAQAPPSGQAQPPPPQNKPSPMSPAPEKQPNSTDDSTAELPRKTKIEKPAGTDQKSAGDHTVQFVSEPPGAAVVIDKKSDQTCKTPCMLKMSSGRHSASLDLDGYRNLLRILNVPQDSDVFAKLIPTMGTLSITSSPPGATILLNGDQQTQTTPAVFQIPPGTYHVRVMKGSEPLDFDVNISDGGFISKNVKFQ